MRANNVVFIAAHGARAGSSAAEIEAPEVLGKCTARVLLVVHGWWQLAVGLIVVPVRRHRVLVVEEVSAVLVEGGDRDCLSVCQVVG